LADSTANYEHFGILQQVAEKKFSEQKVRASGQLAQLGIDSPEKLFEVFSEVYGCIHWELEKGPEKIVARGRSCLLCTIAKKMNIAQPCNIYCINPISALASSFGAGWDLKVNETLWDGNQCEFEMHPH